MANSWLFNRSAQTNPVALKRKEVVDALGFDPIPGHIRSFVEWAGNGIRRDFADMAAFKNRDVLQRYTMRDLFDLPHKTRVQTSLGKKFELDFKGVQRSPKLRKGEVFFAIHKNMDQPSIIHLEVGVAERSNTPLKDAKQLASLFLDYNDRNDIKVYASIDDAKHGSTSAEERKNAMYDHLRAFGKAVADIKGHHKGIDGETLKGAIRLTLKP